jgi:multidrug efflux pump subunit AcrA (membrane-fusion protein)
MISSPVQPARPNGRVASIPRMARGWKKRRRWLLGSLALVLLLGVGTTLVSRGPAPAPAPAPSVSATLVAHGQIVPAQLARVGTLGGGIIRQLAAAPGDQPGNRTALAWVEGPTGTEVLTAPFGGTVTNVLVHMGDTVLPGATILVLADLRTLQVETSDVDQFLVAHVHVGQAVQVSVDAVDNLTVRGRVSSVAALPQSETSTVGQMYPTVVTLTGLPNEVHAGMTVRVTFPE